MKLAGDAVLRVEAEPGFFPGTPVLVSVRPEQLRLGAQGEGAIAATVKAVLPLGAQVVYEIETPAGIALKVSELREAATGIRSPGESVHVAPVSRAACHVFPST